MTTTTTTSFFDSSFVLAVQTLLDEKLVGQVAMTRTEVASALGLPQDKAWMISSLLSEGLLPAFEGRRGRTGGIVRKGVEWTKKETTLDPQFVSDLNAALQKNVPSKGKGSTTRGVIAAKLKAPGSEMENRISLAFKQGLCPGFATARAIGITRTDESPLLEVGEEELVKVTKSKRVRVKKSA